jgi:hypothetical protein
METYRLVEMSKLHPIRPFKDEPAFLPLPVLYDSCLVSHSSKLAEPLFCFQPRPFFSARPSSSSSSTTLQTQPHSQHQTCEARSFLAFFRPNESWPAPLWYRSPKDTFPPPLRNRSDIMYTSSWSQTGSSKTLYGAVLFGDLSVAWYRVAWDERYPQGEERECRYLDKPGPMERDRLVEGWQQYSEGVALFAERAVEVGQPVGSGE